jgi:KDO2-lipid IV(A) lauroyltransferase
MVFTRLISPDAASTSADEQALGMTREMNLEFERWIRQTPGEWVCMKRRWPPGTLRSR